MASTSTNKQPLLIDRVLHNSFGTELLSSGGTSVVLSGTNASQVLVDCLTNDGALIEDIYTIARGTTARQLSFYLSPANDYLRSSEAVYAGSVTSATTIGDFVSVTRLPKVLAPVPQVGSEAQNQAFYVPTGKALWVTVVGLTPVATADSPIVGCQGGFY